MPIAWLALVNLVADDRLQVRRIARAGLRLCSSC